MITIPFYKKKKYYAIFFILLLCGIGLYAYMSKEEVITYDHVIAKRGKLVQEVSVTGRVEAVESVNLAFQIGGKVDKIYVNVGEEVEVGQELVSLTNDDLVAQLHQAQAGASSAWAQIQQYTAALETQQAKLDEIKKGTRPEEIQIAETAVYNAQQALKDAENNLANVKNKAEADLQNVYNSALTALSKAVNTAKTSLLSLSDIQYVRFSGYDQDSNKIAENKATAVYALLGGINAGRWTTQYVSVQNGGVYGEVQNAIINPTNAKTDELLINVLDALQKVKSALVSVPATTSLTSAERLSLDTEKININIEITAISSQQQLISVQKAANENSIALSESSVTTAKNSLATAQDQLSLKQAGYTAEQIKAQEAMVNQAKANLASQKAMANQAYASIEQYRAQIEKTIIRAPINGVVAKMEAKRGEIVLPSSTTYEIQMPLVSIISEGDYEIVVFIAEVDISKVKVGDEAMITLDAYGSDEVFEAVVMDVHPSETLTEGLATYKTILNFKKIDERIKSGMTTNVDILTAEKEGVIVIPQRAVITKEGKKIVRVLKENPETALHELTEVEVVTGLRGSAGEIEIAEGVNEGDKIVTAINSQK